MTPRLRHSIEIRRLPNIPTGKGGYVGRFTTVAAPKAEIEGLDGRESMLESALRGIRSYRITIRWRSDIDQADQIRLRDGTSLNLKSASDPDGRRRWLVLLADDEAVEPDPIA